MECDHCREEYTVPGSWEGLCTFCSSSMDRLEEYKRQMNEHLTRGVKRKPDESADEPTSKKYKPSRW